MMHPTRSFPMAHSRLEPQLVADLVRTQLLELGDFAHLRVRRGGPHVIIEQPGPPEDPEDGDPVLRLTPIGIPNFGLSLRDHTGRWQKLPISGPIARVLAEAVRTLGPWLEPDRW